MKSLHFQGFNELTSSQPNPRRKTRQSEPHEDVSDPRAVEAPALNPLLAMGDLLRDYKLVGETLRTLHLDEAAYHGKCQVAFSALKRMQAHLVQMIEQCERI
jgi:hypothetical protein